MEYLEKFVKMAVAGLGVWRLTRSVQAAYDDGGAAGWAHPTASRLRPEDFFGTRVMDFLYWIGIWMSSQTALWVACGLSGVLLNWLILSGVFRLLQKSELAPAAATKGRNGVTRLCL